MKSEDKRIVLNTESPTYGTRMIDNKKTGFYEPHNNREPIEYKEHTYKLPSRQNNIVEYKENDLDPFRKPHTYSRVRDYDHYYDAFPETKAKKKKKEPKPVKQEPEKPKPKPVKPPPSPSLPYSSVGSVRRMESILHYKSGKPPEPHDDEF